MFYREGRENVVFIDTTRMINSIYNRATDHNYLTCINAVERFNKYFESKDIHPASYKIKYQSMTIKESYHNAKALFGRYFARLFVLYLDEI